MFITLEGIEGSGKTTQLQLLQKWLPDRYPCIFTREPGGTRFGEELRHILLFFQKESIADRAELLLYAADRAQHIESIIKPQLASGIVVICDRFADSTIAYQSFGRELPLNLIMQVNQLATDGLTPDLTLWFDVDVETGLDRAKSREKLDRIGQKLDRIEQADIEFHRRVHLGYLFLAKSHPDRIVRIDARSPVTEIASKVKSIITQRIEAKKQ